MFEVVSQDFGILGAGHSTVLMTTGIGSKVELIYVHVLLTGFAGAGGSEDAPFPHAMKR